MMTSCTLCFRAFTAASAMARSFTPSTTLAFPGISHLPTTMVSMLILRRVNSPTIRLHHTELVVHDH